MSKIKQSQYWSPSTFRMGDIMRVVPKDWAGHIEGKASQFAFTPHTKYLHHFIIGDYIEKYNNYQIGQSTPAHGVNIRWLSDYDHYDYSVLRLNSPDSAKIGQWAWEALPFEGLRLYGYVSILELVGEILGIEYASWKTSHRFKAISASDVDLSDKGLICTQLVPDLYREAGVEILPAGWAPLPCAFEAALEDGIFIEVAQGK